MRYHQYEQSSRKEAWGRHDEESSEGGRAKRVLEIPMNENRGISVQAEERQDVNIGNEAVSQQFVDDMEYRMLYMEIEKFDSSSGSRGSEEHQIALTSTFNNEAEISPSMYKKLMRLIKAMIPNSTKEQKDAFIRDLFDMGIRVSPNSMIRMQIKLDSLEKKSARPSVDDLLIEESHSILASYTGNDSDQNSPEPDATYHTSIQYYNRDQMKAQSYDDFADGVNSILASMDEQDSGGPSSSSQSAYIHTQATNSSDAVDIRWEKLRNKMLNGSTSSELSQTSLTMGMGANRSQKNVETGIDSINKTGMLNGFKTSVPQRYDPVKRRQMELQSTLSDERSLVVNGVHQMKMGERHPGQAEDTNFSMRNRPGQADDSSIQQPVQQRNTLGSDSFSIDAASNSILQESEPSNIPSFDEGSDEDKDKSSSLRDAKVVDTIPEESPEMRKNTHENKFEENTNSDEFHRMNEALKDELIIGVSGSNRMENPEINAEKNVGDDNKVQIDGESTDGSNIIYVKSSLTVGTDTNDADKGLDRSFFQCVKLSASKTLEESEKIESSIPTAQVTPSWRLGPVESLSDFMLTVLSAESGTSINYHVHKHMMAIGPRSSQYMDEVFSSETSSFHVTLDEKTSSLIPTILDYIYVHNHEIGITTDNAVALRQLAKMLKIAPLEMMAANFIIEDMEIQNLVTYVSDCCYFNDEEVMKAVVQKCTTNIGSITVGDRLWVVMGPDLFLKIVSSPRIDRCAQSRHISILLSEYLDLHQYEINVDRFITLTSDNIIPFVDRNAALPLIELSKCYDSKECETLQKRCAYTVACYWQSTPLADRHKLFALLRTLPASLTVDFLEIIESGDGTLEALRSEMEQQTNSDNRDTSHKDEPPLTIQDFCGNLEGAQEEVTLSWRMDPEKSYSDMTVRVKYQNHEGSQIYNVHKQIVASGLNKSTFFAQHLNANESTPGEKVCIVIELDYEGASVVPQVLDFIYSQDNRLDITPENAVAFHYVAREFGIQKLSNMIMEFINQNISLGNVSDYIVDGGYYRDYMTIATAGRLCAKEILSIGIESKLLEDLEPDFFEIVVSCDAIEEKARSHVNVLIVKYFSIRELDDDTSKKLLKSIDMEHLDKHSALDVLKIVSQLKNYQGNATFETMKKKSVDIIVDNWNEMTAESHRRAELFSIFPSLTSDLLTSMFDIVDSRTRKHHNESMTQQAKVAMRCQEQALESSRLREEEVSHLKNELQVRTAKMLALQKELEGKLANVDKILDGKKGPKFSDIYPEVSVTVASTASNQEMEAKLKEIKESTEGQQEVNSDHQSISTTQVQKEKGSMCCC